MGNGKHKAQVKKRGIESMYAQIHVVKDSCLYIFVTHTASLNSLCRKTPAYQFMWVNSVVELTQ